MERLKGNLQVNSVIPGNLGGAIFSGRLEGSKRILVCRVSYKQATRLPLPGECWYIDGTIYSRDNFKDFISIDRCNLLPINKSDFILSTLLKHPYFRGFGLGKKKISDLISEFGRDELLYILNSYDTKSLKKVLRERIAVNLVCNWANFKNEIETTCFFLENKIPLNLIGKIIRICNKNTVDRLKKNPYSLVLFSNFVPNIWSIIERLSVNLNIKDDDRRRLVGAIELSAYLELEKGNTALTYETLEASFYKITRSSSFFESALKEALSDRIICVLERNGKTLFQPTRAAIIEDKVEEKLSKMLKTTSKLTLFKNIDNEIQNYSNRFNLTHGVSLNSEQLMAIKIALSESVSVITGFAGTGKTTVLKAIKVLSERTVYLLALSGKAKERIREATNSEAYTIHSFINRIKRRRISIDKAPILIIDEASMVDITLINQLFSAMGDNAFSLVMVGDTGQLSPVGFGVFWHKLARSNTIPQVNLTKVFRASSQSLHDAAMSIRSGVLPDLPKWNGESEGIYFIDCQVNQKSLCKQLIEVTQNIHGTYQVVTPYMYSGAVDSGKAINNTLQFMNNSGDDLKMNLGSFGLKKGDPVIVTSNCYKKHLFNGNTGCLLEIKVLADQVFGVFDFDGIKYELDVSDCWELGIQLAYAISIHKSQGSEYDTTIVTVVSDTEMLERSMLYTAITRSKKLTLLIGNRDIARKAVARQNRADTLCVGFDLIASS